MKSRSIVYKNLWILSLPIVMVSCSLRKNSRDSALVLPSTYRNGTTTDTASIAGIGWRSFYKDTVLQHLIEKGLVHNQDLQLAVNRIEIADQHVKQSKHLLFPELGLNVSGEYRRNSENGFLGSLGTYQDYIAGLNLSWEIDVWGKIKNQKKVVLAEYLQSYEAKNLVQTMLISNIASRYYQLLLLDKQLEITSGNLLLADSTLVMTTLLYNEGSLNKLAVQQVSAQRGVVAAMIPQIKQEITLRENTLQELIGQFPDAVVRKGNLDGLDLRAYTKVGIPVALLNQRPDVHIAELEVDKANYKIGIARANLYPSLRISGDGGLESLKASDWFNLPASLFGLVAGNLTQPIFLRGRLKTAYEIAKVERNQTVTKFRQTVIGAVTDVSNALVKLEGLSGQEELVAQQFTDLTNAAANARFLYQEGLASYLEVLTAQSNHLRSELELYQIRYLSVNAVSDLYRSLGGGKH